ncbi:MAG: hypothetical protein ACREHV_07790 [Rhizomicrobium sp.]
MSWGARFAGAVKLFRAFHGREPRSGEIAETKGNDPLFKVGSVSVIRYVDLTGEVYEHAFAKSGRPLLFVSSDGLRASIVKGKWKFTSRGFVNR